MFIARERSWLRLSERYSRVLYVFTRLPRRGYRRCRTRSLALALARQPCRQFRSETFAGACRAREWHPPERGPCKGGARLDAALTVTDRYLMREVAPREVELTISRCRVTETRSGYARFLCAERS